jgi:hypothetical protein
MVNLINKEIVINVKLHKNEKKGFIQVIKEVNC